MKRRAILFSASVIGLTAMVGAGVAQQAAAENAQQRADDEAGITAALNGYIGSFYQKQPELLEGAVHPNLKKRDIRTAGETQYLNEMTWSELFAISAVANQGQWSASSKMEIEIFDIELGIATAKVTAENWIDYVHLAQINGTWQIVNVLWAPFPQDAEG